MMFNMKEYKKEWREKNRDKIRAYGYEYGKKNSKKILLLSAKHRSRKKGITCTINEEDILKLNHYTNLQPLCSKINRDIKKDKVE